jgi:hypothetical protein
MQLAMFNSHKERLRVCMVLTTRMSQKKLQAPGTFFRRRRRRHRPAYDDLL